MSLPKGKNLAFTVVRIISGGIASLVLFFMMVTPVLAAEGDGDDRGGGREDKTDESNYDFSRQVNKHDLNWLGGVEDSGIIIVRSIEDYEDAAEVDFNAEEVVRIDNESSSGVEIGQDNTVHLVAPGAGKVKNTAIVAETSSPTASEWSSIEDYIKFVNLFTGQEDNKNLLPSAWIEYSNQTFRPMVDSGHITPGEFERIQAQYHEAQKMLTENPGISDGDDNSISPKEFHNTKSIWRTLN